MLVHETIDRHGNPRGLELAFATPRPWLAPGRRIEVRALPTSFGRVSYAIEAAVDSARVVVHVPGRERLRSLRLRLRLPQGKVVSSVLSAGRPIGRFDARTGTITLPPRPGTLELEIGLRNAR
jgi:hypothetical protein